MARLRQRSADQVLAVPLQGQHLQQQGLAQRARSHGRMGQAAAASQAAGRASHPLLQAQRVGPQQAVQVSGRCGAASELWHQCCSRARMQQLQCGLHAANLQLSRLIRLLCCRWHGSAQVATCITGSMNCVLLF